MKALFWIAAASVQVFWLHFNFLNRLQGASGSCFRAACRFIERTPSPWIWLYEGVLIGRHDGLRTQLAVHTLIVLGLYHLFVVSGGHVLALEKFIEKTAFFLPSQARRWLVGAGLIAFTLVNRLQPACVRAVVHWFFSRHQKNRRPASPDLYLVVVCICLIIQPVWIHSLSFQITCAAILGLAIGSQIPAGGLFKKLSASLFCSAATAPLIFSIQPCLSWIIVPANTFLMPVFGGILFPLSLANVAFHRLRPFTEPVFSWIFALSEKLSRFENPFLCFDERSLKNWGMLYVAALYLSWRYCLPWLARRRFWRSQRRFAAAMMRGLSFGT